MNTHKFIIKRDIASAALHNYSSQGDDYETEWAGSAQLDLEVLDRLFSLDEEICVTFHFNGVDLTEASEDARAIFKLLADNNNGYW